MFTIRALEGLLSLGAIAYGFVASAWLIVDEIARRNGVIITGPHRFHSNRLYMVYEAILTLMVTLNSVHYVVRKLGGYQRSIYIFVPLVCTVVMTKFLTEIFIITMSALTTLVYFNHLPRNTRAVRNWSRKFMTSALVVASGFVAVKEMIMMTWALVLYFSDVNYLQEFCFCYLGLHLSIQFFFWTSIILYVANYRPFFVMSRSEQHMVRLSITFASMRVVPTFSIFILWYVGVPSHAVVMIFILWDTIYLPISVRFRQISDDIDIIQSLKLKKVSPSNL
ncbi:hypothetical protein CRE_15972 [Caenorhabditis remanei]|uniref:Uncharacterized protein n=1 Tax=Caenorhabditis remanei TaxID=31234 RepID=E3MBU5_CAERE|nr:hypothetical protein CRE_15972 [Caenorhabditis remanei]